MTKFILESGKAKIPLPPGRAVIGRDAKCHVAIPSEKVSREHAAIVIEADSAHVEDLDSRNGVFVNGARIASKRALENGDAIQIGGEVFHFFVDDEIRNVTVDVATVARPALDSLHEGVSAAGSPEVGDRMLQLVEAGNRADQALAQDDVSAAEAILAPHLDRVLRDARRGDLSAGSQSWASRYALAIARASEAPSWLDYVVELYSIAAAVPPPPIARGLREAAETFPGLNLRVLRAYVRSMQGTRNSADEAALKALQDLEALAFPDGKARR